MSELGSMGGFAHLDHKRGLSAGLRSMDAVGRHAGEGAERTVKEDPLGVGRHVFSHSMDHCLVSLLSGGQRERAKGGRPCV